jgi:hypothetical protein
VHMLNAKRYPPMNPRDKMPLEVTPVYFKLQRYNAANTQPVNSANPASQQAQPTGDTGQQDPNAAPPNQAPPPNQGPPPGQQPPPPTAGQPAGDAGAQQQPAAPAQPQP